MPRTTVAAIPVNQEVAETSSKAIGFGTETEPRVSVHAWASNSGVEARRNSTKVDS